MNLNRRECKICIKLPNQIPAKFCLNCVSAIPLLSCKNRVWRQLQLRVAIHKRCIFLKHFAKGASAQISEVWLPPLQAGKKHWRGPKMCKNQAKKYCTLGVKHADELQRVMSRFCRVLMICKIESVTPLQMSPLHSSKSLYKL